MTVTKLAIYNDALRRAGAERLAAVDEDVEVRYKLDELWDIGAPAYCLRLARPGFARRTVNLSSPATVATHGLEQQHALPADYTGLIGVYSDADMDQPVLRRIIEDGFLYCEYDDIRLRYVADFTDDLTAWSSDFVSVCAAYLAWQLSQRLKPEMAEAREADFTAALEASISLSDLDEPRQRPQKTTTTLTTDWLPLYNEALAILYRPRLTTLADERQDRVALDTAREGLLVQKLFEDHAWSFSRKLVQIGANSAIEPSFGYQSAFTKPQDVLRVLGVFRDAFRRDPLKEYREEEDVYYADTALIYLEYIRDDLVTQPSSWPAWFWRYVAACLADSARGQVPQLSSKGAKNATYQYESRKRDAENTSFSQAPPQLIRSGSWSRARLHGGRRGRENGYSH